MTDRTQRTTSPFRRAGLAFSLIAMLAASAACSSGNEATHASKPTSTRAASAAGSFDPTGYRGLTATLKGSGSTFQQNFDLAAAGLVAKVLPGLKISYAGGGSGQGKSDLAAEVVDFAGTDSLVKTEDAKRYRGGILYFPTVVAPITVSYNLPATTSLKLDGPTLAKIFTTKLTSWNDPAIAALNPGQPLPDRPITVCRRADASGTTTNFTKFLSSAGGRDWPLGSSDTVDWPAATQGAQGNGGVAACIAKKPGAVGYVDYSDARAQGLRFASVENASGKFVSASLDGASAAAKGAKINEDLTYDPINTVGADVYPITAPTWVIVPARPRDAKTARALRAFLDFVLTDGQDPSFTKSLDYAPLPSALARSARERLDRISAS